MATKEQELPKNQAQSDVFNEANQAPELRSQLGKEVQRFDQLRKRPIGLKDEARKESVGMLNQTLSDTIILYNLYKKHHWLLTGHTFYQLHLLFDKHAEEQLALVDLQAERIQTLGGIAVSDPRHVAEVTRIPRAPNGAEDVPAMLTRLLDAHELIIKEVREYLDRTEKNGDGGTNDILMSEVLRTNELQSWFIGEHTVDLAPDHI